MVAIDCLPVSIVEGHGLKQLLNFLEPGYDVLSRKSIMSRLQQMFEEKKQELKAALSHADWVALTTDCWTSTSQEGFMTVTVHFLSENWSCMSAVLDTSPVTAPANLTEGRGPDPEAHTEQDSVTATQPQRHTAVALAAQLGRIIADWEANGKVSAVVHDNAANVKDLGKRNDTLDVGCAAHKLQLCINKGFNASRNVSAVIAGVSRLVGHFRRSILATKALELKQQSMEVPKHRLVQSVQTRWNSTYEMLQVAIEQRWPLCSVLSDAEITKLTDASTLELTNAQWALVEELVKCLKPLQVATTCLSYESNTCSSCVYPIVQGLKGHLKQDEADSPPVQVFKKAVCDDLDKRFSGDTVNVPLLTSALDPRYKNLEFLRRAQRDATTDAVRELLQELDVMPPAEQQQEDSEPESAEASAMNFLLSGGVPSQSIVKAECERSSEPEHSREEEYEHFLQLKQAGVSTDPCKWWFTNSERFPTLSKLARKLLCIPATSVPSERVFSTAGNVVSAKRSCLKAENVNMLVFLAQNSKLKHK